MKNISKQIEKFIKEPEVLEKLPLHGHYWKGVSFAKIKVHVASKKHQTTQYYTAFYYKPISQYITIEENITPNKIKENEPF